MSKTLEELMALSKAAHDGGTPQRAALESALRELIADAENLRGFAQQLLGEWPDVGGEDGFALQAYALKFGLLEQKMPPPTEPCGENCNCAGYFDRDEWTDGVICYRKTARLKGDAQRTKASE